MRILALRSFESINTVIKRRVKWLFSNFFYEYYLSISKINNTVIIAIFFFGKYVFGYITLKSFLYSLFFSLLISSVTIAQVDSTLTASEIEIIDSYRSLLADKVTNNLLANYKEYLESPNEYWNFLKDTFLRHWDFDALYPWTPWIFMASRNFRSLKTSSVIIRNVCGSGIGIHRCPFLSRFDGRRHRRHNHVE